LDERQREDFERGGKFRKGQKGGGKVGGWGWGEEGGGGIIDTRKEDWIRSRGMILSGGGKFRRGQKGGGKVQ
jgi:hypothetical protein